VASEHRPVLASRFAPAALSSSGAAVSEAQPETNHATAIRVIVSLMDSSPQLDGARFRNGSSFSGRNHRAIAGFCNCVTPETSRLPSISIAGGGNAAQDQYATIDSGDGNAFIHDKVIGLRTGAGDGSSRGGGWRHDRPDAAQLGGVVGADLMAGRLAVMDFGCAARHRRP
jgi:hypothetical protein